jgi:hypothetical protein
VISGDNFSGKKMSIIKREMSYLNLEESRISVLEVHFPAGPEEDLGQLN